MLRKEDYIIEGAEELITPALVYYEDIVRYNIEKVIAIAGDKERLWPHVKTFKMGAVVKLIEDYGIHRFKCATIAEAEMCALEKAEEVLLAYPLIGPDISRFIALLCKYPQTRFWAIGDDYDTLSLLSEAALKAGVVIDLLLDVNIGMNRTGVSIDLAC